MNEIKTYNKRKRSKLRFFPVKVLFVLFSFITAEPEVVGWVSVEQQKHLELYVQKIQEHKVLGLETREDSFTFSQSQKNISKEDLLDIVRKNEFKACKVFLKKGEEALGFLDSTFILRLEEAGLKYFLVEEASSTEYEWVTPYILKQGKFILPKSEGI